MTANDMLALVNRTPFEPLEIHLNNGTTIRVQHPYQIATTPNAAACVVVYGDDDVVMRIVPYRNIAEVITRASAA
jgi:hypothetical protein